VLGLLVVVAATMGNAMLDAYTSLAMSLALVNDPRDSSDLARAEEQPARARDHAVDPPIGLTSVDLLALDGLADPRDVPAIVDAVKMSATALAGSDRNAARVRLVARAVASERARMLVLQGMLDERLLARDFDGVAAIDRLLTSTTKRLAILLGEHRAACSVGQRPTVLVGHADAIHVEGGER